MFLSEETRRLGIPAALSPAAAEVFSQVATLPAVCALWNKSRKAVLMRLYKGDIEGWQDGKIWLVFLPSVVKIWGELPTEKRE